MSRFALNRIAARAARSAEQSASSDRSDGELLMRFLRERDEAAFAELVSRLGPMVLGTCRRIVRDAHLAEDAFQAAFVVLARRASDVRLRDGVRGWMYGVAVRTALRARSVFVRQTAHELASPALPEHPAPLQGPLDYDLLRVLDEEVSALPEALRSVVVLCELDGLSRKEAAVRLGIPEGTVSSRLAAARKRLAERLRERGVVLSVTALSAAWARDALALPRAGLIARTVTGGTLPATVAELSRGCYECCS
jgi:RNA polymerase sigma factor (sigma-70 family)